VLVYVHAYENPYEHRKKYATSEHTINDEPYLRIRVPYEPETDEAAERYGRIIRTPKEQEPEEKRFRSTFEAYLMCVKGMQAGCEALDSAWVEARNSEESDHRLVLTLTAERSDDGKFTGETTFTHTPFGVYV
jgi:hypothetical protein